MILATFHLLANLANIDKDRLPVPLTDNLGRRDLVRLKAAITRQLGVVSAEHSKEAVKKERVGESGIGGLVPDTSASDGIARLLGGNIGGGGRVLALGDTGFGELGVEVGRSGLLLLLLFGGQVELDAVLGAGVVLLGLLLLFGGFELLVAGVGGGFAILRSWGWMMVC